MKKYNLLLKAFVAIVAMLSVGFPTLAHDFEVDGIFYKITNSTNKTVAVTYKGIDRNEYSYEYSGTVTIPSSVTYNSTTYSVTEIGLGAFEGCIGLTSISIPNSVTEIGDGAFVNCAGLKEVTIGNSVTKIGASAFGWCNWLTSITIPNSVTEIGHHAFSSCSRLTSVTIPNSVTKIGNGAFHGTSWYNNQDDGVIYINNVLYKYKYNMYHPNSSITIKEGTISISPEAFYSCSWLTSVIIPNSVIEIGYRAFSGCYGLTSVTIPNSVTEIGDCAFMDCAGLKEVTVPNSVTRIGDRAFEDTPWYNKMPDGIVYINNVLYKYNGTMPSNTSIAIKEGIVSISPKAFSGCDGLISVIIPNSVKEISNYAFNLCTSITEVNIPNSVTEIGEAAFVSCEGLTYISIGNSVTSIGEGAFSGCLGLTEMTIPNSVTEIGEAAFAWCKRLTSVYIGNSITEIGWGAFEGCNLETVTSYCETPPVCDYNAFYDSYSAILKVPEGTKDAYANAPEWKKFTNIQEIAGVEDVEVDNNAVETSRYDIHGRRLSEPAKGINIVKMSDGSTKKIMIKD